MDPTTPDFMSLPSSSSYSYLLQVRCARTDKRTTAMLTGTACSFPIIARRFPKLPIPHRFLFLSRHFGTGVLIATAFVHLLPTAFVSLTDPCLPAFWTDGYPASAGLIAMMSVFMVVGIEMFFATRGAGHMHGPEYGILEQDETTAENTNGAGKKQKPPPLRPVRRHIRQKSLEFFDSPRLTESDSTAAVEKITTQDQATMREEDYISRGIGAMSPNAEDDVEQLPSPKRAMTSPPQSPDVQEEGTNYDHHDRQHASADLNDHRPASTSSLAKHHEEQKMLLQCLLLEAGILFHSIFIGMALSVATGTPFIVLLVAISFHQTFEGLALGSRIAAITSFGPRSPKPWLMALAYGTTTPIGQAIGLIVHRLYDPESQTGLLMVGIMNAISSGLLLFAGLVELLAEDFLSDKSYETLHGKKRLQACGAVVAGSLLMALVGAWA